MAKMANVLFVVAAVTVLGVVVAANDVADANADVDWDYSLEQSFDGVTFQPRNSFRIRSPDLGRCVLLVCLLCAHCVFIVCVCVLLVCLLCAHCVFSVCVCFSVCVF